MMKAEEEDEGEARRGGGGGQQQGERKSSKAHGDDKTSVRKGLKLQAENAGEVESSEGLEALEKRDEERLLAKAGGEEGGGHADGGGREQGEDQQQRQAVAGPSAASLPEVSHNKTGSAIAEGQNLPSPAGGGVLGSQSQAPRETGKRKGKKKAKTPSSSSSVVRDPTSCEGPSSFLYGVEEDEEKEEEETPIFFAPTICKFLQPDLDPRALLLQNLWSYRWPSMPYFPPHTAPAIGAMVAAASSSSSSSASNCGGSSPATPAASRLLSGTASTVLHCISSSTQILTSPSRKRTFRTLGSTAAPALLPPGKVPCCSGVASTPSHAGGVSVRVGDAPPPERILFCDTHAETLHISSRPAPPTQEVSSVAEKDLSSSLDDEATIPSSVPSPPPPPSLSVNGSRAEGSSLKSTCAASTTVATAGTKGGMVALPSASRGLRINLNTLSARGRDPPPLPQMSAAPASSLPVATESRLAVPASSSLHQGYFSFPSDPKKLSDQSDDHHEKGAEVSPQALHRGPQTAEGAQMTTEKSEMPPGTDEGGGLDKQRTAEGQPPFQQDTKSEVKTAMEAEGSSTTGVSAAVTPQGRQCVSEGVEAVSFPPSTSVGCSMSSGGEQTRNEEKRGREDTAGSRVVDEEGRADPAAFGGRSPGLCHVIPDHKELTPPCKQLSAADTPEHARLTTARLAELNGQISPAPDACSRACKTAAGTKRQAQQRDSRREAQSGLSTVGAETGLSPASTTQEEGERTSKRAKKLSTTASGSSGRRSPSSSIMREPNTSEPEHQTTSPVVMDSDETFDQSSASSASSCLPGAGVSPVSTRRGAVGQEQQEGEPELTKTLCAAPASSVGHPDTTQTEGGPEDEALPQSLGDPGSSPTSSASRLLPSGAEGGDTARPGGIANEGAGGDSSECGRGGSGGGCSAPSEGSPTTLLGAGQVTESLDSGGSSSSSSGSSGLSLLAANITVSGTRQKPQKHPHQTRSSTGVGPRPNQALSPYYYVGTPPASQLSPAGGDSGSIPRALAGAGGSSSAVPHAEADPGSHTAGYAGALAPYETEGADHRPRFFASTPTLNWSQLSWSLTEDETDEDKNAKGEQEQAGTQGRAGDVEKKDAWKD